MNTVFVVMILIAILGMLGISFGAGYGAGYGNGINNCSK